MPYHSEFYNFEYVSIVVPILWHVLGYVDNSLDIILSAICCLYTRGIISRTNTEINKSAQGIFLSNVTPVACWFSWYFL